MGVGHFSITENLWKSDPGVIILYRIVTYGSLYPRVNILYDTGINQGTWPYGADCWTFTHGWTVREIGGVMAGPTDPPDDSSSW